MKGCSRHLYYGNVGCREQLAFRFYKYASLAANKFPFSDVSQTDWYRSYVEYVQQEKLFNGTSDTTFTPARDITRAEFLTVLGRMHTQLSGETLKESKNTFTDISAEKYYASYIGWAEKNGIVKGFPDGTFHPDEPITREMMAVMLDRYCTAFKSKPETTASISYEYKDAASIAAWAEDAVKNMTKYGILCGDNAHNFLPQNDATRAETAAVFTRTYQGIKYQTEKDVKYSSLRYTYEGAAGKTFLGEKQYQVITDYSSYADLLKAANADADTSFQALEKDYFDTKNVLAVELQSYGTPNYTTKLTDYQEGVTVEPVTRIINLTFFHDGLYGATADTVEYLFFIELPDKEALDAVMIQQVNHISNISNYTY